MRSRRLAGRPAVEARPALNRIGASRVHGSGGWHLTRRGFGLFAALSVIWGIPYLLIKVAVRDFSPPLVVFLRTALGTAVLLPIALARGRGDLRAVLRKWPWILSFAAVEVAIPWVLLTDVERQVSSSLAGLMMASVPLVGTVLMLAAGGQDRAGWRRTAGLLLGLAGVIALLGFDVGIGDPLVVVKLALVVIGYAAGPLIIQRKLSDLPTLAVVTVSLGLCALAYAPVGMAQLPRTMPPMSEVAAVVALGLVCTALAFVLFFQLIAEIGAVRATVITYVNPAVAVLAGVTLLGEPFTAGTAAGLVLILAGSWLATSARGGTAAAGAVSESRRLGLLPHGE